MVSGSYSILSEKQALWRNENHSKAAMKWIHKKYTSHTLIETSIDYRYFSMAYASIDLLAADGGRWLG